jgi:hypothetical protein
VKHDRLDDEVMVIDLNSGAYFAFVTASADAWSLLASGHDAEHAGTVLAERYSVAAEDAAADVALFAQRLVAEGLLEDSPTTLGTVELPPVTERLEYVAPDLERFEDLADLLLIDPVHEVEPTGWPAGRQD